MRTKSTILSLITILVLLLSACAAPTPTAAPVEQPAATEPAAEPSATSQAIVAQDNTPTPEPEKTEQEALTYKEAPELAEQVAAGSLPPVEERIPVDVAITAPVEAIGQYGGTLHVGTSDPNYGDIKMYLTDPPIKWKADMTGYEPGLAKSYEWSEDGMTFTLHMREGVRWSDGEPYTSADWKFWWEDLVLAEEQKLYTVPSYMRNLDGTPITLEFPDDYTVVWKSTDRPMWIDPYFLAQGFWEFADPKMKPAHYLKQFHPKYTDGATWEKFQTIDKWWDNPDFPCLMAWCTPTRSEDGTHVTLTRNPYYWRVDTEGNQLPYIDTIDIDIVADDQVRVLNAAQGKYDAMFRGLGSPNNMPLLQEQAEKAGFRILEGWKVGTGAWPGWFINMDYVEGGQNYADDTPEHAKEIRDLFRDKRFRQALSIAIDRQRIIEVAWKGIGEAKGYTLSPQSWHFAGAEGQKVYEEWAKSYAYLDYDEANALLDEVGMKRGADGIRTLPSGKEFTMIFDVTDWGGDLAVNLDGTTEMANMWEENLGIKSTVNNLQGQPTVDTRFNEGYYMLRPALFAEIDIWTFPDQIFPIRNRYMFPLQGRWYEKGKDTCVPTSEKTKYQDCGMKPEPGSPAETLQKIYEQGIAEKDIQKRHELVWDAIKLIEEEGPFILSVSGDQPAMALANVKLRNLLDYGVTGPWAPAGPGSQVPAQWWFEQ